MNVSVVASAQEPSLPTVLARAAAYVTIVEHAISGIVAEEHYTQRWTTLPRGWPLTEDQRHRQLRSDFLIVKLPAADQWLQFRDVFDVDGAPVRDRDERLMELFVKPPTDSPDEQVARIMTESSRYNIGNIQRNINTPLLSLVFLDPEYQPRFRFFRTKDRTPLLEPAVPTGTPAAGAFVLPAGTWIVRFEEGRGNNVIHTANGLGIPSHGRFWIDPATGRVLMTELVVEDRNARATIDVSFQLEPTDAVLLPLAMRERYEGRSNKSLIEGMATYGKFRQFTVNVDEKFLIKK